MFLDEHNGDACNDLTLAVCSCRSLTDGWAYSNLGEIAHVYGDTILTCFDDDTSNVFYRSDQANAAQQVLFPRILDICAAHVGVVLGYGVQHITQREAEGLQLCRVDSHLILLLLSPEAVDFGEARHAEQLSSHIPILNRPQFRQAVAAPRPGTQFVLVNRSQPGRDRS